MTIPLTNKQLEERRKNLKLFREEVGMSDESTLHTTLLMQEEWLATIDAYKELLKLYKKTLQFYAKPKSWTAKELEAMIPAFLAWQAHPLKVSDIDDNGDSTTNFCIYLGELDD